MNIVSFVILHYKDYESTDLCVRSIQRMDEQERIRIVIVDNDIERPQEERAHAMQRYQGCSNMNVLFVRENGGFSYANNLGYEFARGEQNASFIVVLNNDVEFTQADFVRRLEEAYAKHSCHVLGPDIVRRGTGEHQNPMDTRLRTREEAEYTIRMNRWALKFYPILYPVLYWNNQRAEQRMVYERSRRRDSFTSVQENIVPFGACLIFTPKFVQWEEKAFWPETSFFYEEYILALRCQRSGYKIVFDPTLNVFHESGHATKKNFKNEKQRLRFQMKRTADACLIYKIYIDTVGGKCV